MEADVEQNSVFSIQPDFRLNPLNPAFEVTFSIQFLELYKRTPSAIKSFDLCISPLLDDSNQSTPVIISWGMTKQTILFVYFT